MSEREQSIIETRGLVRYGALARDVVGRVFHVDDALIEEQSALADYASPEVTVAAAYDAIEREYGVDCRHIKNGNLIAIARWLEPRIGRARPWWAFWRRAPKLYGLRR
jgi:hypothetical protein